MAALSARSPQVTEYVPLSERVRSMQVFRAVLVAVVLLLAVLVPQDGPSVLGLHAATGAAYLVVTGVLSALVLTGHRATGVRGFGAALLLDGAYLAWLGHATGEVGSSAAVLVLLQVVAVSLLGSFRTGLKLALWHSLLAVTVVQAEQTGLLLIDGPGTASSSERGLVASLAVLWLGTLTTTTFAAVSERELRRRRYDAEALGEFGARLQGMVDPAGVDAALTAFAVDTLGAGRVAVVTRSDDGRLRLAGRGLTRSADVPPTQAPGTSLLLSQVRPGGRHLVTHLDPRRDRWLSAAMPGARRVVVLAVGRGEDRAGYLVFEHTARRGSRIERRVVGTAEQAVAQAWLAHASAAMVQRLAQAARTDGLTGLANRRSFDDVLAVEVERAVAEEVPCSLLLVDLDHFKRINDEHGHQAGDDVLRAVAAVLQRAGTRLGPAARYGGEEFAMVLPGTGPEQAVAVAEHLRAALRQLQLVVPVTASFGIATAPQHGATPATVIEAADRALYAAKAGGRDRAVVADGDLVEPEPAQPV